jgi:hypothetical protein
MDKRKNLALAIYLTVFALSGCANNSSAPRVYTDPYAAQVDCRVLPIIPDPPSCLTFASMSGGGFTSQWAFQDCRRDLVSFEKALNLWASCVDERATDAANLEIKKYNDYLSCLEANRDEPRRDCRYDRLASSRFIPYISSRGPISNQMPYGPSCSPLLRPGSASMRAFYDLEIQQCASAGQRFGSELARWKDTVVQDAELAARDQLNDAIRKFNCIARGSGPCF